MQNGLLFQSLLHPDARLYHEQLVLRITGNVNVDIFEQAWRRIVQENEVLRTVLDWKEGEPLQIILNETKFSFKRSKVSIKDDIKEIIKKDLATDLDDSFDLENGPLIRFKLIQCDTDVFVFRISYHHIILDGSSIPLLFEDFTKYYQSLLTGVSVRSSSRPPYKEYIRWLQSQKKENAQKYWKIYLSGYTRERNNINISSTHESLESSSSRIKIVVPDSVKLKLMGICKSAHITVNNMLQTIWSLVLLQNTKGNEVIFGSTVFDRPPQAASSEKMIGLFINTLPIRVNVGENDNLISMARNMQLNLAEMQEFSFLPLSEIKKQVSPQIMDDPFDSIFVYSDHELLAGHQCSNLPLSFQVYDYRELTNYSYTIDATFDKHLSLQLTYTPSKVRKEEAARVIQSFLALLEELLKKPDISLFRYLKKEIPSNTKSSIDTQAGTMLETNVTASDISRTKFENDLTQIWEEVLNTKGITQQDNFFELGGDSIICLRIVSQLMKRNYSITLREVFEHPTIRGLSQLLEKNSNTDTVKLHSFLPTESIKNRMIEKYKQNVNKILPLSYLQKTIVDDYKRGYANMYHDQSSFEYQGEVNYKHFEKAWNIVIETNPNLKCVFFRDEDEFAQLILKEYQLKLKIFDISNDNSYLQDKKINEYKERDLKNSFKIEEEPPLRIALFKLSNNKHVFILSFSVLLLDGWCFAFVLSDFYSYYESLIKDKNLFLVKRNTYEKYLDWLMAKDISKGISHWKNYLKGTKHSTQIERNRPKKDGIEYKIQSLKKKLSPNLIRKLESLSKNSHITMNSLFQAIWAFTLHKISSQPEIVIGATVSGRPPELDGSDQIIGLFFNDLPLKFSFPKGENIISLAKKAQSDLAQNREYEYISNSQMKKAIGLVDKEELFQTLFIFENYPKQEQFFLQSENKQLLRETRNWRREASRIDINLYVEISNESSVEIKYISDLFSHSQIKHLLDTYLSVIKNQIAN